MSEDKKIKPKYNAITKSKIADLEKNGVELDGTESPELIDTYYTKLEEKLNKEQPEAEYKETPGVPDRLPVLSQRMKIIGKEIDFPNFFVAAVKGGLRGYDFNGKACTGVAVTPEEKTKLSKDIARHQMVRWNSHRGEYK